MKKTLFSAVVLASIFVGCGGGSSCCSGSESLSTENLGNVAPVAAITGLTDGSTIQIGESVTVNGTSSSDRDGTVTAYTWTVDGNTAGNETNPTFTFNDAGAHEICLTVTDNDNLNSENIECKTVNVEATPSVATPVLPTAVITLTDSDAPLKIFSNHTFSCAASHDNDTLGTGDEIVSCNWDIQSYKMENGQEVLYRNCSPETMEGKPVTICGSVVKIVAKLTVTDNDGQTASTSTEYTDFTQ